MHRLIAQCVCIAVVCVVTSGCSWSILNSDPDSTELPDPGAGLDAGGFGPQVPADDQAIVVPPGEDTDSKVPIGNTTGILYAIPQETQVRVGDRVRVVVTTSRVEQPFAYMNSVAVVTELGATYVPGSFNHGSIGGERNGIDGFWAGMEMTEFLGMPENLIVSQEVDT